MYKAFRGWLFQFISPSPALTGVSLERKIPVWCLQTLMKHPIRRRVLYTGFCVLKAVVQVMPLGGVRILGKTMGLTCWLILPAQKRLALNQLDIAFGDTKSASQKKHIVWQVFLNLGLNFFEWLKLPRLSASDLQGLVECSGLEHIHSALKQKRGVMMLSAHFGNWEIISPYLASLGFKGSVLARKLRYPEYEQFLISMRESKGVRTIERSRLKDVARALKENQLIGIMPDQDVDSLEGLFVDFFGKPAYTPIGPAAVAMMTKAPIVPCFIRRNRNKYILEILPAVVAPEKGDRKEILAQWTQDWSRVVEQQIARHPEQWVWVHRRWKTQPNHE